MSKYEQICEVINTKVSKGEITEEHAEALLEAAAVKYEGSKEDSDEDSTEITLADAITSIKKYLKDVKDKDKELEKIEDELEEDEDDESEKDSDKGTSPEESIEEGANFDIFKSVSEFVDSFKAKKKEYVKAMKDDDYNLAKKKVKEMMEETTKLETNLNMIDSSTEEAIIGSILKSFVTILKQLILLPASIITLGVAGVIDIVRDTTDSIVTFAREYEDAKKSEKGITADVFNAFKNEAKTFVRTMNRYLKKLEDAVKKAESVDKETKESVDSLDSLIYTDYAITEESVEDKIMSLRLEVFEAAEAGLITGEQKSVFLEYLTLENYEE